MSVVPVEQTFPVRVLATAVLAGALVLAAGAAGAVPPVTAVALSAAAAVIVPGVALIRTGLAIRAMIGVGNACRGTGMLGLGVLAGGLSVLPLPFLPAGLRPVLAAGGLALAACLCLLGLLLLPGVAASPIARLRRAFDGVSMAISLALLGWLLLPGVGAANPVGYVAVAVTVGFLATTTVAVLRAIRHRPIAVCCGGGAALVVVGLALLVAALGHGAAGWTVPASAVPLTAGPIVIWTGARRTDLNRVPAPPADGTFAGLPLLAVPVGACLVLVTHRLITVGPLDWVGRGLGLAVFLTLLAREVIAAADVRRYARRMAAQEAHLRALVGGASDVAMVLADDLVVRWQSPAAARQFGLLDQDVIGRRFTDLIHPDDAAAVVDRLRAVTTAGQAATGDAPLLIEARLLDGYGRYRETESTVSDQRATPEVAALVVHVRDVGERRQLERTVQRLTSTDRLTGLPNRRELIRAVAARRRAGPRAGALVVVELSGVSGVNQEHGRGVGDTVLVEAALRLRTHAGTDDLVGRLGGRRFAVITPEGPIEAYALGVRLLTVVAEPYEFPDRLVRLEASAGLAELATGEGAGDVLRRAEVALERATAEGPNRIEWYDESLEQQLVRRMDLERFLPGATGRGELDLVYQPVMELTQGRPVGVEALLRWRHPVLGTVGPCELLPIADRLRLGGELGRWVLHTACRQAAAWRRDGYDLWLAVNVTRTQLADDDFAPEVAAALSIHQTPPERLTVEIAEAEVGEDIATLAGQLGRLRALGVRTALDDFSGSHTSLDQLRRLPLDLLKISALAGTPGSALLAAGVDVARRLGLEVVAEQVETQTQLERVRGAGCRYGQGHLFTPPAPAERIEAYLEVHRTPSL